jgi:hypothetical protein
VKSIDDHADLIGVTVCNMCPPILNISSLSSLKSSAREKRKITRKLCLSRFWKLDDDGVYLITLNSAKHPDFPNTVSISDSEKKNKRSNHKNQVETSDLTGEGAKYKGNAEKIDASTDPGGLHMDCMVGDAVFSTIPTSPGPVVDIVGNIGNEEEELRGPSVDAVITVSPRRGEGA